MKIQNYQVMEHNGFRWLRQGRLDGLSATKSRKELDKVIKYAEQHRNLTVNSTPHELDVYNIWTDIKILLEYLKEFESDETPRNS